MIHLKFLKQLFFRYQNKISTKFRIFLIALSTLSRVKNNEMNFISNLQRSKIIKIENDKESVIKNSIKNII